MVQSTGSQRVRQDLATEQPQTYPETDTEISSLNRKERIIYRKGEKNHNRKGKYIEGLKIT